MKLYSRQIKCVRCGPLMAWTWAEGDQPKLANLQPLFANLKKHQRIRGCHMLMFDEKVISIPECSPKSLSQPE